MLVEIQMIDGRSELYARLIRWIMWEFPAIEARI